MMQTFKDSRRSFLNKTFQIAGLILFSAPTLSFSKSKKNTYLNTYLNTYFKTNRDTYLSLAALGAQAIKTTQVEKEIQKTDQILFHNIITSNNPMKRLHQHSSEDFSQLNIQYVNGWTLSTTETKFCIWVYQHGILGDNCDSRL